MTKRTAALLFVSIFGLYLAMSPNTTVGRGYVGEEINSGIKMIKMFDAWVKGRPIPPMEWTRHGPIPVLFDIPFIRLGGEIVSSDYMMSMSPILFTSAMLWILFLWLRKLTSPAMSLLLTVGAGFGTLLWPYAYIGLETKMSFFVLLAGYLGIANGRIRAWPKLLLFATACGLAMTVKSTGAVMAPVFAYLVYLQFRGEWRSRLGQIIATGAVIGVIRMIGDLTTRQYWAPFGGGYSHLRGWLIESPLQFYMNLIGIFGSPTKGLFVYAPILLFSVYALARAIRLQRDLAFFSLLVVATNVGLVAMLIVSADEVWGTRYMHVLIAPLVLCIGAAWPQFEWKKHIPLVMLIAIGMVISFLGSFFYYGIKQWAQFDSGQNTMEWLNGDPKWNEVTFAAREFRQWRKGCPPFPWTNTHIWVWEAPPGAQPWKTLDLAQYCQPQSPLVTSMRFTPDDATRRVLRVNKGGLIVGLILLIVVGVRTVKETGMTRIKVPSKGELER
jgi:hypothetical protein